MPKETLIPVVRDRILIKDSNGIFIDLSAEEFLMALQHGLGLVANQIEEANKKSANKHKKTAMYVRSLSAILQKIRPTHLNIGILYNDRSNADRSGNSDQGNGIQDSGVEEATRVG